MATIAALAGAAISAYGANRQAAAANKPRTGHTDQVTEQNPFLVNDLMPGIGDVLAYQRGVIARGTPQLNANGTVTYSDLPWGTEGGRAQQAPSNPTGPSGSGFRANPAPAVPPGGQRRPDGRILDGQGRTIYTPPAGGPSSSAGRSTAGGGAGARGMTSANGGGLQAPTGPARPDTSNPQGIFSAVAQRGLDAGNTGTVAGARNMMDNIWGDAGRAGGTASGSERTGFEGYNPILDRQAQRLETDADSRVGRDLLLGFLNENNRGGGSANGSAGGGKGSGSGGGNNGAVSTSFANSQNWFGPKNTPNPNASGVPDTMVPESFFGTQTRKIFDEQANDAELADLIKQMKVDVEKGQFRDLAQLDAAAQSSGRFGGDMWKGLSANAREEAAQEMAKNAAGVRVGDREARRQAQLAALQGVNARDQSLLNANVQREGIAANERSSSAATAASAAGNADQLALARRGQDLSALGSLMDSEQFGINQLGQIGGQLSSDRLGSLGMVPGLEGIGIQGLNAALGAGGGMVDMRGQDTQRAIAGQQAGIARQGLNQQMGMWNAGQQQGLVNNYLGTLMNIGQMGGTSRTTGTNVVPGLGVSPTGAAATAAVGGAALGAGLYQTYRGY